VIPKTGRVGFFPPGHSVPAGDFLRKICGNSPLYKVETHSHSPAPMNLAAIDWLSISINLLLVIFVIVCLLMILLILMQRPKQEGLGAAFGAGVTDQVFGARTTNVLQRGTVYLASLFFLIALTLAVLIGHKNKKIDLKPTTPAAKVETAEPATPDAESVKPKSLSEELPGDDSTPAETPVKPETPTPPPVDPTPPPVDPSPAPADPSPAPPVKADTPEEKSGQP
jgi:preprotein translocase subunit SecG